MNFFPTFAFFVQRHPRVVAIIGVSIFIISVVLFITVSKNTTEMQNTAVESQGSVAQDEIYIGDTFSHDYAPRYDAQNTTYDMTGYIRKITGDVLTVEDTTPMGPSGSPTREMIEVVLAQDCIFAQGNGFVVLDEFKAGDNIFLKTLQEGDIRIAYEIFKADTASLSANAETQ